MKFDYRRSHTCGELTAQDAGTRVTLSGWVHKRRDLGGVIFIDLRDRFGRVQLVFDPAVDKAVHDKASALRSEWVISIHGTTKLRAEGRSNARLATGEIEIAVHELEILSIAKTPPFSIADEDIEISEDLRLHYRYLDIRRGKIANYLLARSKAMQTVRRYMHEHNFVEITTPILAKSTPEGARDYLVPSRLQPGSFYALPQSPQIFKQLLMVSGMDRYFQLATCFRDEDLRSDRQPEFMQIDIEMSFSLPEDLMAHMEVLMSKLFAGIQTPFLRLAYKDALEFYGTDRPDMRFGLPLIRLDSIVQTSSCSIFLSELAAGGCVKAIRIPQGASTSRKEIDRYTQFVQQFGLTGLAWIKRTSEGISSSIAKFFTEEEMGAIFSRTELEPSDLLLIAAGAEAHVNQGLDHLRRLLAKERNLIPENSLKFLWVIDFPLMKWNADEARIESEHHPFTAPHPDDIPLLDTDPLKARAVAYDLVLNGYELGGGSQRIHQSALQEKVFKILNLSETEVTTKFGFFVEALKYGTPPHLGIALGFDRIVMLLCQTDNIRDVIAFPKTQKGSDQMMEAPAAVSKKQLDELKLNLDIKAARQVP